MKQVGADCNILGLLELHQDVGPHCRGPAWRWGWEASPPDTVTEMLNVTEPTFSLLQTTVP